MALDRREKLIETARKLFYRNGIHATGIDRILAEAGVAKMTLYKHFKSKEELILAALRRQDEEFRNFFMRTVERKGDTPRERLLAVFDAVEDWCSREDFSGCAFINASAEFSRRDHPIHVAAAEHKQLVLRYLKEIAASAGAEPAAELADQIFLLMEGALVTAHFTGHPDASRKARRAAEIMIRAALDGRSKPPQSTD